MNADWEGLLVSLSREKCRIIIDNHSPCLSMLPNITTFVYHNYSYDNVDSTLVEVFSADKNGQIFADSFFYDKGYETEPRRLQSIERLITESGKQQPQSKKIFSADLSDGHTTPEYKLPIILGRIGGFTAFLRTHPASFRDALFTSLQNRKTSSQRI